tara:strand:- start:370 stop:648 length:279 start_codon:yes stop_codon:yes gene_type:complete
VRNLFTEIVERDEDVEEIFTSLSSYEEHLSSLYEMEMFYGDSTLQGLLEHSKQLVEQIDEYRQRHYFEEEDEFNIEEIIGNDNNKEKEASTT